ncbi:hypothetical protein [Fulvivirga sedimenti]|jgi:hypothetical protein|uniref:Uncharacterized protein n=1 Tax=Fulvivirga sedimenti TaxID=2879465 RepID=A0A9X1HY07_9BACT|nr:hypothetical protein [Fulvivirga sedimenti]MCA6078807.1 hypothetical protein [Fulvivirga sedimenti]
MRQFLLFSLFALVSLSFSANAQQKPVHPVNFYDCMGKNLKWADRYIRSEFGVKAEKEIAGKDTVRLNFYNTVNDVKVSLFFVDEVCEYIGFSDYNLDDNSLNTFFTRWCTDVTEHYRFISDKDERYPMFEDTSFNMVFYIPENQPEKGGLQYFMFSGFIRGERILTMN